MKHRMSILILLLGLSHVLIAQEKQHVYTFVEERHEKEWYLQQFELWKEDALNGSGSPNAWYNYYSASRSLRFFTEDDAERTKYTDLLEQLSKKLLELHPDSFEANYVAYWHSGFAGDMEKHLWKAVEINPDDRRLFDDLLIYYELKQDAAKRAEVAERMIRQNYLAPGILSIAHNMLSELDDNAIMFTAGDNDTYAVWLNQFGLKYRQDVITMNIYMILEPEYRELIFKKAGISNEDTEGKNMMELIQYILENSGNRPVYIPASVYDHIENDISAENLYLTGLTYRYSEESIDNLSLIRRNYEKRYLLDHIRVDFATHRMDAIADDFECFYIVPFLKLYHIYGESEEWEKQKEVRELLENVVEGQENEQEVLDLLNGDK